MKINKYLLASSLFLLPLTTSAAEDLSVLIYGASIHSGCEKAKGPHGKTCDFNNINPGLGADWVFLGDQDTGKLSLRGGAYEDSYEKLAAFAGFMYRKEWYLTGSFFAGLGLQAGYLDGSGMNGFAVLPVVSLGYKNVALEIGYAPKMDHVPGRKHAAVTSFGLRWAI
ncbi:hypothetical protein [Aeromonas dhakensis]|uniref:hypothetical protein n=1 Tax=Aeromonas dhakensis TaxID=196024 RepID=UPI0038D24DA5